MKFRKKYLSFLIVVLFFGCSMPKIFQVVVNQGNLVDKEMLEKLEVGMTESQVKYVLGTPLITDTFNANRWDYYTSVSQGKTVYTESKVTLYFEEGKLLKWNMKLPEEPSE
tara:strand:+ start:223 stop:555 length:333 start_codon:yes stop_codon:yes gene_type:complete